MTRSYAVFVVLGFLAVVLLIEGVFMLWTDTTSPEVKRIRQRLRMMTVGHHRASDVTLLKQRLLSASPRLQALLVRLPKTQQLDRLLLQTGSTATVARLLTACLLLAFGGILLGVTLSWAWPLMLLAALLLAVLPVLRLLWLRARRVNQIGAQLPDALDMISRALRAGHAFPAALSMVGEQAQEPIASEFKATFDEINFGLSTQAALKNLALRVPIPDLRYFVLAVVIQLETGGNLAELLSMLANLMRERFKLFGRIRVLAAEGKLSAYILTALPFCVAGMIQIVNPGYLSVLFVDSVGIRLVITALVMMILGIIVMWRIIDIRV
ncbi:MAG: type II secretion system F family protein [Rhodoferax sp.]|uniref:type II secretion system F family protein n=1 Tax=Rhodoferax sp. TaxID=50421 RepID=UPI00261B6204|nr:type II secretion system F family protein [Rhodoferax sp.]MDD5333814.1 type II secretion system F family protein [Rhodoferax sp.]